MKHPIHPMLVHFPIACWSIATCFDVFSQLYSLENVNISGVLILIGIVLALPTMLTGLIDMSRIDNDSPAIKTVNKHMFFVFMAWMLYALSLYIRVDKMSFVYPNGLATLFSLMGFINLSIAGWHGGNLVYKHNVGRNV